MRIHAESGTNITENQPRSLTRLSGFLVQFIDDDLKQQPKSTLLIIINGLDQQY